MDAPHYVVIPLKQGLIFNATMCDYMTVDCRNPFEAGTNF